MRDGLREKLNTEMTRKQFLQYLGAALLMVFGLNNIISFLAAGRTEKHLLSSGANVPSNGFGSRRFGE